MTVMDQPHCIRHSSNRCEVVWYLLPLSKLCHITILYFLPLVQEAAQQKPQGASVNGST